MLDLGGTPPELTHGLAGSRPRLGGRPCRHGPAALAETCRLPAPAVEDVRDDGANLVAFDAHPVGDLRRELVRVLRHEGDRADPCQAERLECAALASGHGREVARHGAGAVARAWRTRGLG